MPHSPKGKRKDGSKTDLDADGGHKGHGYSMHVNMEKDSKLMEDIEMTSARPHDSQHFEDVLIGNETHVWADSAYRSKEQEAKLEAQGVDSHILEKAKRNSPLTDAQQMANKEKSKVRARVEHGFGQLKTHDGFTQTRYYGLPENRCDAFLHGIAYNLRRGMFLLQQQVRQVVDDLKHRQEKQLMSYCV